MERSKDFEAFFKENYTSFYFFALHLIDDEETSRDIVSDSFEHAWHNFHSLEVSNWKSYLMSYIRNKCVDYIRHEEVKRKYVEFYLQLTLENNQRDTHEYDERILKIRRIIATLSPQTRLVFSECYLQEKSYKEVAENLNISTNAVKKHIVKALKTIREACVKKDQSE